MNVDRYKGAFMENGNPDRPITLLELARLSANVYNPGSSRGNPTGWARIQELDLGTRTEGFFGTAYRRGNNMVVAIRGTSDTTDALADAHMIPLGKSGEDGKRCLNALLTMWTHQPDSFVQQMAANLMPVIFNDTVNNNIIGKYLNRIPDHHSEMAGRLTLNSYRYTQERKSENIHLRAVTGHSLGGALAQYVCEQTGVGGIINLRNEKDYAQPLPGVSFNGPFMGEIGGMRLGHGGKLVCCNNIRDPLSKLTKLAGNKDHATDRSIEVDLGFYSAKPPSPYENNWTTEYSNLKSNYTVYWEVAKIWYQYAALYYHGIDTLVEGLKNRAEGQRNLQMAFL